VAMAWTHPVAKGRRLCPGEHDCDGAFGTGQDAGCPTPPNCRLRTIDRVPPDDLVGFKMAAKLRNRGRPDLAERVEAATVRRHTALGK
jgi:hypothetical protein